MKEPIRVERRDGEDFVCVEVWQGKELLAIGIGNDLCKAVRDARYGMRIANIYGGREG